MSNESINVTVGFFLRKPKTLPFHGGVLGEQDGQATYNTADFVDAAAMLEQAKADMNAFFEKAQNDSEGFFWDCAYGVVDIDKSPKHFYPTGGVNWFEKAYQYHAYRNGKPVGGFQLGQMVEWSNVHDVSFTHEIFGFDTDGTVILSKDAYWAGKKAGDLSLANA